MNFSDLERLVAIEALNFSGGLPRVRWYRLTWNDQIGHGKTYGEGRSMGQPRPITS